MALAIELTDGVTRWSGLYEGREIGDGDVTCGIGWLGGGILACCCNGRASAAVGGYSGLEFGIGARFRVDSDTNSSSLGGCPKEDRWGFCTDPVITDKPEDGGDVGFGCVESSEPVLELPSFGGIAPRAGVGDPTALDDAIGRWIDLNNKTPDPASDKHPATTGTQITQAFFRFRFANVFDVSVQTSSGLDCRLTRLISPAGRDSLSRGVHNLSSGTATGGTFKPIAAIAVVPHRQQNFAVELSSLPQTPQIFD